VIGGSVKADRPLPPATAGFDLAAAGYEAACGNELFLAMRARVQQLLTEVLPAAARVLEIGCGVGLDTEFLVRSGHRVTATDPAPGMLERARRRLDADSTLAGRASWRRAGLAELSEASGSEGPAALDAIVSNFGALNCVADLTPLGFLAHRRLRSGGVIVIGLMTRVCLWEIGYHLCRFQPRTALRRLGRAPVLVDVERVAVPTWYHGARSVAAALGPEFVVRRVVGLNVLLPPPHLVGGWRRMPAGLRRRVQRVDGRVARWPLLRRLGDHVVIVVEKR
jgi:SAM-dependent methyltransferase